MDYRYVMMGPFTVVRLEDIPVSETQVRMARFHMGVGDLVERTKALFRGETDYGVKWKKVVLAARGTGFSVSASQRIGFVHGNDLWLMNSDGTGRTNLITAPIGGRIGRFAFDPDGTHVVYEVWHPASGEPQTIDLWTALSDGSSAHVLASAGDAGEDTGVPGYHYVRRWCVGPSFSPDGSSVAFLRTEDFQSDSVAWYPLRETSVCRIPISGGSESALFTTKHRSGFYSYHDIGQATEWREDGTIHFPRSGAVGARISLFCDASNTNLTAWPATVYAEYNDEMALMPTKLSLAVGAQSYEFSSRFYDYGNWVVHPNFVWTWTAHPAGWRTPAMGAWFGPLTISLAQTNSIRLTAEDGQSVVDSSISVLLIQKAQSNLTDAAGSQAANSAATGLWSMPAGGGTPSRVLRHLLDSFAWDPTGQYIASEHESGGHTIGLIDDAAGGNLDDADLGAGEWSSIGNWDDAGWRVVYWIGSSADAGRVFTIDPSTGDTTDLGEGRFPLFVPIYRAEVRVMDGSVSVTDTNYANEVIVNAGQMTVVDDLAGDGLPQPATAINGPYVTNIVPASGSLEPATGRVSIVFQFNEPIRTNSLSAQILEGVSWPVTEPEGADVDPVLDATIAAAYTAEGSGRSFAVTASNLVSAGVATFSWNAARTALTFVMTNRPAFPINAGNRVRLTFDVGGLSNDAGRALSFAPDGATIQMIDLVTTDGALLRAPMYGVTLGIPPGALSQPTPIRIGGTEALPGGAGSPTNSSWRNVGGGFVISPAVSLLTPASLAIPVKGVTAGAAIWFHNGTTWSNIGGAYNPADGTITASITQSGLFAVFYPSASGASLHLVKGVSIDEARTNDEVRFALRVWNTGRTAATNTTIVDALPAGFLYITNSAEPPAAWTSATRTLSWNLGTLPPGERRVVWFAARVHPSQAAGSVITNIATASAKGAAPTNSGPATVRVISPANVERRLGAGGVLSTQVTQIAALGVGYRRGLMTITTAQTEDTNLISFSAFDAQVTSNQAVGLSTYGIVNAEPTAGIWPQPTLFADAFRRVVERYDGDGVSDMPGLSIPVHAWELFDRFAPNSNAWSGCSLDLYDQYLLLVSPLARVANPDLVLLPSAVENASPPGTTNYLEQLVEYDPGAIDSIDAISVCDRWERTMFSSAPQHLEALSHLGSAEAVKRGLWITAAEFVSTYNDELARHGITCTETDQALYMARSLPFALASGVEKVFYNEVNARPVDTAAQRWAALIDTNGHRRMAFYTLQKLAGWIDRFTWSRLTTVSNTVLSAEFTDTNEQIARIVWDVSNAVKVVTVPVGPVPSARVTSLVPLTWNDSAATWRVVTSSLNHGLLTLAVSGTPVCIEAIGVVNPDIDADGTPNPLDADADGDGMAGEWEIAHGLNPFVDDRTLDPDGDGQPNGVEAQAGTDPQSAASRFVVDSITGTGTNLQVRWTTVTGRTYRVSEGASPGGSWSPIESALCATGAMMSWRQTTVITNAPRFFRVDVAPLP